MTQGYGTSARAVGGYAPSLVDRRATFIVRTYNHLFVALLAFAALEGALFAAGLAAPRRRQRTALNERSPRDAFTSPRARGPHPR